MYCVQTNDILFLLTFSFNFSDQAHNVTIHNKDQSLRAGSQHEFTCEALGSRPPAMITWWFDDEQIQPEVDRLQIVSISDI